jgi:enoyl-CoA hydratase/carnithine racemase
MDNPVRLVRHGRTAVIETDNPPVNALSRQVRDGLVAAVDEAARSDARAILLHCAGRTFFSGADIAELDRPLEGAGLLALAEACAAAPQPVIAAMHGSVLGGGVVVAYCADHRLAAPGTKFGLPEVKLGLLATFGGTQYLPRLLGLSAATDLLIGAEPVTADQALGIGLIDGIVDEDLLEAGLRKAADLPPKRSVARLGWSDQDLADGVGLLDRLEADLVARAPGWEAPLATIAAVRAGLVGGLQVGLAEEAKLFDQLKQSRQSAILRRLFFAERKLARAGLLEAHAQLLVDACGGPYDRAREDDQRAAIRAIGAELFGGPELADAAIVRALGWPIWKADVFAHDPA